MVDACVMKPHGIHCALVTAIEPMDDRNPVKAHFYATIC